MLDLSLYGIVCVDDAFHEREYAILEEKLFTTKPPLDSTGFHLLRRPHRLLYNTPQVLAKTGEYPNREVSLPPRLQAPEASPLFVPSELRSLLLQMFLP